MVHDLQSEIDSCLYLVLPPIHKGPHLCYWKWFTRYSWSAQIQIVDGLKSLPLIKVCHQYSKDSTFILFKMVHIKLWIYSWCTIHSLKPIIASTKSLPAIHKGSYCAIHNSAIQNSSWSALLKLSWFEIIASTKSLPPIHKYFMVCHLITICVVQWRLLKTMWDLIETNSVPTVILSTYQLLLHTEKLLVGVMIVMHLYSHAGIHILLMLCMRP